MISLLYWSLKPGAAFLNAWHFHCVPGGRGEAQDGRPDGPVPPGVVPARVAVRERLHRPAPVGRSAGPRFSSGGRSPVPSSGWMGGVCPSEGENIPCNRYSALPGRPSRPEALSGPFELRRGHGISRKCRAIAPLVASSFLNAWHFLWLCSFRPPDHLGVHQGGDRDSQDRHV